MGTGPPYGRAIGPRHRDNHAPIASCARIPFPLFPSRIRWAFVPIIATLIVYSSLVIVPETVVDNTQPEFIALTHWRHLVASFAFVGSLAYATDDWSMDRWRKAALVIAIAASYGICMEIGQHFLPHRTPFLLTDAAVNTLGASGVVIWYLVRPYFEPKPVSQFVDDITATPPR